MKFEEYFKTLYPNEYDYEYQKRDVKHAWEACKKEVLKMLKDNASKYLTFEEARKDIEKNL